MRYLCLIFILDSFKMQEAEHMYMCLEHKFPHLFDYLMFFVHEVMEVSTVQIKISFATKQGDNKFLL